MVNEDKIQIALGLKFKCSLCNRTVNRPTYPPTRIKDSLNRIVCSNDKGAKYNVCGKCCLKLGCNKCLAYGK